VGKLGSFTEAHGLMVLVVLEFLVLMFFGRRDAGGRAGGE
jgi:hypothetical protein